MLAQRSDLGRSSGLRSEAYLLPDDVDAAPLEAHLADYLLPVEPPMGLTPERAALQADVDFFSVKRGAYKAPKIKLDRESGGSYTFRTLKE